MYAQGCLAGTCPIISSDRRWLLGETFCYELCYAKQTRLGFYWVFLVKRKVRGAGNY